MRCVREVTLGYKRPKVQVEASKPTGVSEYIRTLSSTVPTFHSWKVCAGKHAGCLVQKSHTYYGKLGVYSMYSMSEHELFIISL